VQIGFRTAQAPPSATTITLEASRTVRPRSYDDALYPLTQPVTVRIPSLDEVQVEMDADGNTLGDPNRFLLVLSLGRVKCMYLGGKWDRHLGGVLEDIFKDAFQTPVCTHGHLRAGDTVTLEPGQYSPDVGPIHDDDDGGGPPSGDHAEIAARVITGNPFYPVTRVRVTLDVVPPTAP